MVVEDTPSGASSQRGDHWPVVLSVSEHGFLESEKSEIVRKLMGWKKCSFVICLGALLGMASEARADLVINEIMSRPINQSTNGQYEFIELFNTGNDDVLLKVPAGETFDLEDVDSKRVLYKSDKLQEAAHE